MYSDKEIRSAASRAVKNILYEGLTDVDLFSRPFELEFLKNEATRKNLITKIERAILNKDLKTSNIKPYGKVLVPKNTLADFRICALIDVYDEIYYLTLAILMGNAIEAVRIRPSRKRVFSYRFIKDKKSKELFDSSYSYTSFKKEVKRVEQTRGKNIVIECDISNFYDRLNLHRLESTLLSIKNIDKDAVELLNDLLLHWSNRDSYGLPVGSNASRILAESLLSNVDKFLEDKKIPFCRFVDDYRLFAKDATEAYSYLTILIERLQIEGLFVNSNKTKLREIIKIKKIHTLDEQQIELVRQEEDSLDTKKEFFEVKEDTNKSKEMSKIIRGYSGLIPLKFRELTNSENERLKQFNITESYKKLKNDILIDPKELREFLKATIVQNDWKMFGEASSLLEKFPQFIPYYINIFVKKENLVDDETIELLKKYFINFLNRKDSPEYIQIYVIRFFSREKTFDKEAVLNFFYNLSRDSGDYIGRATLEVLNGKLNRNDLLTLRKYFVRADIWEKRKILHLLNIGLPQQEKNAYFKNISITNTDLLIEHMVTKKTGFMKE